MKVISVFCTSVHVFSINIIFFLHSYVPGESNFHRFYLSEPIYRVFSHDVNTAILVSQNNETVTALVSQTSPLGVELFSYANAFFCSNKFAYMLAT